METQATGYADKVTEKLMAELALALRWDAVDLDKRVAHVKRTVALGEVVERLKVGNDRFVLLNERAIHALERQAVRRATEIGKGARDRNAVHFPAFEERLVREADVRPAPPMATNPQGTGDQIQAPV